MNLHTIEARLKNADTLQNVAHAMRSQAAIYYKAAEIALVPIRAWARRVRQCLAGAALRLPSVPRSKVRPGKRGVVIFTSDQGLCGAFNDRIIDFALSSATGQHQEGDVFFAVGRRGADLMSLRGVRPHLTVPAPTSLEGVHQTLQDLGTTVFEAFGSLGLARLSLCTNLHEGPGRFTPTDRTVLPLAFEDLCRSEEGPCPGRVLSSHLPPVTLVERLTREYFFILLYGAAVESYASENGARLAAMEAAMSNIEDKVAELTNLRNLLRQEVITAEVLEVATGAAAVSGTGEGRR
jgi:F-type H+-transporting ATPase subunit gamma